LNGASTMAEPKIVLHRLTKFDQHDLGHAEGIEYAEAALDPSLQGEVVLFTAIVTMSLISTVAAYLLRKHNRNVFEEEIEIRYPDGTVQTRRIRWNADSTEPPEAALIRQIRGDLPI
jgi:hypothetical protein